MRTGRLVVRKIDVQEDVALTFNTSLTGRYIRANITDTLKDSVFASRWLKLRYEN